MINIKKLEEKEVIFINNKTTKEEDLEFSKFLKDRKLKQTVARKKKEKQS